VILNKKRCRKLKNKALVVLVVVVEVVVVLVVVVLVVVVDVMVVVVAVIDESVLVAADVGIVVGLPFQFFF
jgi:hypothetical protein